MSEKKDYSGAQIGAAFVSGIFGWGASMHWNSPGLGLMLAVLMWIGLGAWVVYGDK